MRFRPSRPSGTGDGRGPGIDVKNRKRAELHAKVEVTSKEPPQRTVNISRSTELFAGFVDPVGKKNRSVNEPT